MEDSQKHPMIGMMRAQKVMATIDEQGQLTLDNPLNNGRNSRVEVIVLMPEEGETQNLELINDFRQAWHEAMTGDTIPVEQLWKALDHA